MDRRKKIVSIVIVLLALINFTLIGYLVISKVNDKKIVTFNMRETVDLFLVQVKESNLTEEQIQKITMRFNQSLDTAINDYSNKKDVVILVSAAVVKGADDVTNDIQNLISEQMAK